MEGSRPHTGEEPVDRRQFLKKLALGAGAVGMAGVTGFNILEAEKAEQQAWREEIRKRGRACQKLGVMEDRREESKVSEKTQDWVPEKVKEYNKRKRNALIAGATTEAAIVFFAFEEKIC